LKLALFAAAILATQAAPARADCGKGSSTADVVFGVLDALTHSSNSSSSSSSSPKSAASNAASAGECETNDQGELVCHEREEKAESSAPIHLELQTGVRSFASLLRQPATGTVDHEGEQFSYRMIEPGTASSAPQDTALVGQVRASVGMRFGFYAGGEAELGVVANSRAAAEMVASDNGPTPDIARGSVTTWGGAAILGISERLGPLTGSLESASGFRAVSYSVRSVYGACVSGNTTTLAEPILEGRVRAAAWVTPHVAVGGTYGKSLVDDAWLAGAYVDFTSRRFGGR
jgi:hypothetical protein